MILCMPHPDYITTAQAADMLGVDRSTLTRWVQGGKIRAAVKLPSGAYLFARADLEQVFLHLTESA